MKSKPQGCLLSKTLCTALTVAMLSLGTPPIVWAQAADSPSSQVTLNFVNAEVDAVARAMGVILKRQFIVDPRVRGTITLYSEEPMSRDDAYRSFQAALRGLGFAVVQVEDFYKIVPEADAKLQTGTVSAGRGVRARRHHPHADLPAAVRERQQPRHRSCGR